MIYFNEIDPFCAQWCRNAFGGEVDERDIRTIEYPVVALRQHYFAGLGGWEWALRLAGWPDDREIWTGSCPCQPFSVAGNRKAHEDERDLWPAFFRLIAIGRPATVVGEQVAGAIAFGWLDRVCDDLEGIGYAVGAAVLPASGVGAPHIRQRLYWVANRLAYANDGRTPQLTSERKDSTGREPRQCSEDSGLADSPDARHPREGEHRGGPSPPLPARPEQRGDDGRMALAESQQHGGGHSGTRGRAESPDGGATGGLGDPDLEGRQGRRERPEQRADQLSAWAASETIYCADGHWRRVPTEPSLQPLANGRFGNPRINPDLSSRVETLRASGNAIVIPLAAEFLRAIGGEMK